MGEARNNVRGAKIVMDRPLLTVSGLISQIRGIPWTPEDQSLSVFFCLFPCCHPPFLLTTLLTYQKIPKNIFRVVPFTSVLPSAYIHIYLSALTKLLLYKCFSFIVFTLSLFY
jgi:hypothetical protein